MERKKSIDFFRFLFIFALEKKLIMRTILFTLFILLPLSVFGQSFKPGKITYTNGKTISGLIEYNTPLYTPQSFNFKESKDGKLVKISTNDIDSIVIPEYAKFIKKEIQISYHSNNLDQLDTFKKFNLTTEIKFIEVLTEGKYTLYKYEDDKTEMFYYSEGDQPIKPLLYKKYYTDEINNLAAEEKLYLNELQKINCANVNLSFVKYTVSSLENFFEKTNNCEGKNNNFVNVVKSKNKSFQKNKITASYSFLSNEGNAKAYEIGYEWEKFLPFYNYTFTLGFSPYYRHYQNSKDDTSKTNYSLEFPLLVKIYPLKSKFVQFYVGYSIFNFRYAQFSYLNYNNKETKDTSFTSFQNTFFESGITFKDFEVYSKYYFNALTQYDSKSFSLGLKYNFKTNKKN